MAERVDWSKRTDYIRQRHGIEVPWADEAVADPVDAAISGVGPPGVRSPPVAGGSVVRVRSRWEEYHREDTSG